MTGTTTFLIKRIVSDLTSSNASDTPRCEETSSHYDVIDDIASLEPLTMRIQKIENSLPFSNVTSNSNIQDELAMLNAIEGLKKIVNDISSTRSTERSDELKEMAQSDGIDNSTYSVDTLGELNEIVAQEREAEENLAVTDFEVLHTETPNAFSIAQLANEFVELNIPSNQSVKPSRLAWDSIFDETVSREKAKAEESFAQTSSASLRSYLPSFGRTS